CFGRSARAIDADEFVHRIRLQRDAEAHDRRARDKRNVAPVSISIRTSATDRSAAAERRPTIATGAGGSKATESYLAMRGKFGDLLDEVARLRPVGQPGRSNARGGARIRAGVLHRSVASELIEVRENLGQVL